MLLFGCLNQTFPVWYLPDVMRLHLIEFSDNPACACWHKNYRNFITSREHQIREDYLRCFIYHKEMQQNCAALWFQSKKCVPSWLSSHTWHLLLTLWKTYMFSGMMVHNSFFVCFVLLPVLATGGGVWLLFSLDEIAFCLVIVNCILDC